MAVSAADFYTYAKSTGTEIPDSKQKEAELVPVINRWKKGRLREENKPEQDNTGRNIGAAALGTGAAALAYGIGRRLGRGKGSNPVSKPPQAAPSNLPNVDNVTGLADTTFIPSPITPQDSRGVKLAGIRNPKTGTYRAAVNEIQEQAPSPSPSTSPQTKVQDIAGEEALWDSNYWANFHAIRKADPSLDLGEVDRRAVLAAKKATNQPIREDYTPGPATDHRIELQNTPESSPVKFSPRSYAEGTGSLEKIEPKKSSYITETAEKDIGPEHFMPGTNMSWDDVHWNAEIGKYAPDTLVAKQNLNNSALSIQSSEAVDTGVDQAIQRIDTEVQRDTDSISLGKSAVKTEVLQEDLLEQAAAKSIANNQLLDKKAADGTLTRAEEGAWLQSELDRSGTTPQELFGQESIEAYMDTYMPKEKQQNFVADFIGNERSEIASQLGEMGIRPESSKGKTLLERELANRLGRESYQYGRPYT